MQEISSSSSRALVKGLGPQIAERIKRELWAGRFEPGEPIREQRIAEQFSVSRGPVRDALLQLTKEGLLVAEANRGARVRERVSGSTRMLLVRIRRTIEEHSLHRGFPEPGAPIIRQLQQNVEAFRRACESENFAEVVELDMAFHRLIVSMDPQDDLEVIWLPVIMQLSLPYSRHHKLMESYDEHHAIVEAIEQGQKAEAVRKLKRNIR